MSLAVEEILETKARWQEPTGILARWGTQDSVVIRQVLIENEYRLPEQMDGQLVLDIGANIGCFALACLFRNAHAVICFEPNHANYRILLQNLEGLNAEAYEVAVWRSDKKERLSLVDRWPYTAMFHVSNHDEGAEVKTVGLDELLKHYGKVDLLKLDCEGSEYPILYSSKELWRANEIIGEYHPQMRFWGQEEDLSPQKLEAFLREQGFVVELWRNENHGHDVGHFSARRES